LQALLESEVDFAQGSVFSPPRSAQEWSGMSVDCSALGLAHLAHEKLAPFRRPRRID
jgi:hypothetical protein